MVSQSDWQHTFGFLGKKPVVVEPVDSQLSSDAGLLPIREFDESVGFTQRFAEVLEDRRDQRFTEHAMAEMTRSRIYGILADYEDQNDHDTLRSDPVFKIVGGHKGVRSLSLVFLLGELWFRDQGAQHCFLSN